MSERRLEIPAPLAGLQAPSYPGLSAAEARRRFDAVGPNEPASAARRGPFEETLRNFANPLILVLLGAAIVSVYLGILPDAAIILAMIGLSLLISYVQTRRSHRAVAELRGRVAVTATAYRDGWVEVPRREIVPGDVVHLSAGDLVPADCELIEAKDLHVQQAALTGESAPSEKEARPAPFVPGPADARPDVAARDFVFQGTSVLGGTATALVRVTGGATVFGDIAARLARRRPETEFERGIRAFGTFMTQTIFLLVFFIVIAGIVLRTDLLETLLFALALAVGLTPEFLPMISTITLARGAVRMARRQVIVKNLAAIQNFGSIDVLCSDKTGTLTLGELALGSTVDAVGTPSPLALELARVNSRFQTGIANPIDRAILHATGPEGDRFSKVDEVPFDFERRRLSVVVQGGGRRLLITKGAPEAVLPLCAAMEAAGEPARPLAGEDRARAGEVVRVQGEAGQRTIAVAYRPVVDRPAYGAADERDLVLAGFLSFEDPPLSDVGPTLRALARDGVEVKILTGDSEVVARHVLRAVGMDPEPALLGRDVDALTDTALAARVRDVRLFARVSPSQKNRVILALRSTGHVVGFLGDGVNDAPSMHAADVGISVMGAVDVAREAADIVLTRPDLGVLHDGIREGREAFGNVVKYILMGTSSNFGNMFSMAGAFLFLPFLPMLPDQILLNNFLYDLTQASLPTDRVDPAFVRKPRRWDIRLIRNFMVAAGPVSSVFDFATFFLLLEFVGHAAGGFQTGWFIESLATQTLVVFVIRTTENPLRSRPSSLLVLAAVGAVAFATVLPYSPLASFLGFTPLPALLLLLIAGLTATYLAVMTVVRSVVMRPLSAAEG